MSVYGELNSNSNITVSDITVSNDLTVNGTIINSNLSALVTQSIGGVLDAYVSASVLDGYAFLNGKSGGQTLKGGTAASENLTLQSTEDATKGKILFGTSAYDETNDRLGVGSAVPQNKLDINGSVVIGSTYSGDHTAPTDGLLVEGQVGFRTNSPYHAFEVSPEAIGWGLTGTISSSGTTVSGNETQFLTDISVGQLLTANGQTRIVTNIASDISLTINFDFSPNLTAETTATANHALLTVDNGQWRTGINTANMGAALHVADWTGLQAIFEGLSSGSSGGIQLSSRGNSGIDQQWQIKAHSQLDSLFPGSLLFHDVTDSRSALIIDNLGKVGIGTTSPAYSLHTAGDAYAFAYTDSTGWVQHNSETARLAMAYGNGSFGGSASANNLTMSARDFSFFDTTSVNENSSGFSGAVFDGRYVYYAPYANTMAYHGQITRYDTTKPLDDASAYSFFNAETVNSDYAGFWGGVFDGRYVYFAPAANNTAYHGNVMRYDTTKSFTSAASYAFYDLTNLDVALVGFSGAIFDGYYVYFVPGDSSPYFGKVVRYNSVQPFTEAGSYSVFDTESNVDSGSKGFCGAIFDGRYIFFVPYYNGVFHGQVTRYDTTQSFTSAGSYSVFNTSSVNSNSKGFNGAVFDGRYIYYIPFCSQAFSYFGQITRYDTTQSFTSTSSYSVFDTTAVNSNSKGFQGAVFDGKYIYFIPYYDGNDLSGQITRYDTTQPFNSASSYSIYNTAANSDISKGFQGGTFDGKYVYIAPYNYGQITRLRAWSGGIDSTLGLNKIANSSTLFLSSSNNIGIGTDAPSYLLDINAAVSNFAMRVFNSGSSANNKGLVIRCGEDTPANTPSATFIEFQEGDGTATGNITSNNTGVVSLADTSDERRKINIADSVIDATNIVKNIRTIEFNRISRGGKVYDKTPIGVFGSKLPTTLSSYGYNC